MYNYEATVKRVVDGDTVDLLVDLGLRVCVNARIRLRGINAPEMHDEGGPEAKTYLESLLPQGKGVIVSTFKNPEDKFGRWLGDIKVPEYDITVNILMVTQGKAAHYDGGKR